MFLYLYCSISFQIFILFVSKHKVHGKSLNSNTLELISKDNHDKMQGKDWDEML